MHEPQLIYETVYGSRAFGLDRAGSDEDRRGIVVGPRSWYLGHRGGPEQIELSPDHVRFEIRKFLRLAVANNPSALEMLFVDPADRLAITPAGRVLLDAREVFLSRRVADTFGRYADGQLRRIRTHRRWLLSPPSAPPTREGFGLPERTLVPKDQLGAAARLLERGATFEQELAPPFLDVLAREKRFAAAKREWDQYRQWQKNRNPRRAELEVRHGYDTKHAMHLVRLQRMALEILEGGRVVVKRPDRAELLAIRDGVLTYDALVECAEAMAAKIEEASRRSPLPAAPDEIVVEALGVSIVGEVLAC